MSNYIKATDFASKDSLLTGDPLKIVSGTEIDDEYNAIQTAINSKANTNSPALTGSPTAPTATAGTNTTQISTTAFVKAAIDTAIATAKEALYPVGSIYTNATNSTNPGTLLGFGTWVAFGAGRVMVGLDSSNTLFDTAEETGGSADTVVVSHTHDGTTDSTSLTGTFGPIRSAGGFIANGVFSQGVANDNDTGDGDSAFNVDFDATHTHTFTTDSSGESGTNKNLQPYITVYMWRRTA